ncbi:MAG: hypothetical protein ABSB54_05765 [Acidimicrobiales bacterium]|jgi:hypothetical protein
MTPIAGLIIAMIAGFMVANGRRAASVVLVPWLVVLAYQSWYIASGRAISPPSTVTQFPSTIGYWFVQVIILAPALGIAAQLGASASRRRAVSASVLARRAWVASALCVAAAVVVIVFGFVLFPHQGGTVAAGHHNANGSPPLIGMVGILGSYIGCAALGVSTLVRRRTSKHAESVTPVRAPATVAARH